jgi:hypothetical protein
MHVFTSQVIQGTLVVIFVLCETVLSMSELQLQLGDLKLKFLGVELVKVHLVIDLKF